MMVHSGLHIHYGGRSAGLGGGNSSKSHEIKYFDDSSQNSQSSNYRLKLKSFDY